MYKRYHLLQKPESIFVVSELKIATYPRASAYIACNARGTPLAPFVVFHSDPVQPSRLTAYSLPEFKGALFFNAKGTHGGDALFVWFRDHFVRCKTSYHGRSVILFVACPVSEISLRLVQLAEEERVVLVSVPSTVAHLVQPLSSGILRSLNAAISAGIQQLVTDGKLPPCVTVSQSLLATILAEVWADKWSCDDVRDAFAACGIFPLNVRAITAERIAAATSDNVSDSYIMNESSEDIVEDVTHGLNLLSELSTLEQQKESCIEQLIAEDPHQNVKQNVSEILDDANSSADSLHNCLQYPKPKVSTEILECFYGEDRGDESSTHTYSHRSSSVVCQPYICDQFECTESSFVVRGKHRLRGTRRLVTATDSIKLSNYTSSMACQSDAHNMSSVKHKKGVDYDKTHDRLALNSWHKNVTAAVGREVVDAQLSVGVDEARQKPALSGTGLNERNDSTQSVFCDTVPVCCEPHITAHNSDVDAALPVICSPSVGSCVSVRPNSDQHDSDSDRTKGTQIEFDVAAECDVEDSRQHVCCEVTIY